MRVVTKATTRVDLGADSVRGIGELELGESLRD